MLRLNEVGTSFLNFKEDEIVEILKRDDLQVMDEMKVFESIHCWGMRECRMKGFSDSDPKAVRKQIDKLLKCVRFPLMKSEDFVLGVQGLKVLKQEEEIELLRYFALDESKRYESLT